MRSLSSRMPQTLSRARLGPTARAGALKRVLVMFSLVAGSMLMAADGLPGARVAAAGDDVDTGTAQEALHEPGPADACKDYPAYALDLGFEGAVAMSTNIRGYPGLVFIGHDQSGQRKIYQHPSWTRAGYLAAYAYDGSGNIYVAPSPLVSLWENPPEKQNRIWKIDAATRVMTLFAELPPAAAPSSSNPFGVLGLTYDCDLESLYATSVMGSTPDTERGRVFRIDVNTGEVDSVWQGRDSFGVGIRNTAAGKRLYLGSARTSGVYSAPLDAAGGLREPPRIELYLSNFPDGANDQVKRILFTDDNLLKIKGINFHYTLKVASAYPHSEYVFRKGPEDDWRLIAVRRGLVR